MKQIRKFVCSKSPFFEAFIEKGLKFTSSLYLMLIWIRFLKFLFHKLDEVNKQMKNVPFFDKFQKSPTADNCMDALIASMGKLQIVQRQEIVGAKRRLMELADSNSEEEQVEEPVPKKKKSKKAKKSAK